MSSSNKSNQAIAYLLSLLVLVLAVGLILTASLPQKMLGYISQYITQTDTRWGIGITGALLFLLSGKYLFSGMRSSGTPHHAFVKTGEMGEIHISLEAINNLITRAAQSVKGVKEVKPRIKNLPEGIAVLLLLVINPDLNIPEIANEVQKNVAEYLQNYGGVEVLEVKVIVENVQSSKRVSRVE